MKKLVVLMLVSLFVLGVMFEGAAHAYVVPPKPLRIVLQKPFPKLPADKGARIEIVKIRIKYLAQREIPSVLPDDHDD